MMAAMKKAERRGILWVSLIVLGAIFSGCKEAPSSATPGTPQPEDIRQTPDPALARTLQADVASTASWLLTLTPATPPAIEATLFVAPASSVGTPPAARNGVCPIPGGFVLHDREGFCLATPASWVVFNADGGIASFLKTTPGQVLAARPDWAQSATVCSLLIYVSLEESALSHLSARHRQFSIQNDIQEISRIQAIALGEMGILGFNWNNKNGGTGAVYAEMIGSGKLLHISYDGSNCLSDDMLPILETLRIDTDPVQ
jgi:hypothetical protein